MNALLIGSQSASDRPLRECGVCILPVPLPGSGWALCNCFNWFLPDARATLFPGPGPTSITIRPERLCRTWNVFVRCPDRGRRAGGFLLRLGIALLGAACSGPR